MVEIPRRFEANRQQSDTVTVEVVTVIDGVCTGKSVKQIVEAAIFLNDDDDVLDLGRRRPSRLRLRGKRRLTDRPAATC